MIRPRVLLADDHPALLRGTSALLKPQFEVVGNVKDGETLVSEARRLRPDVIVADITLPVLSGIDVVHELRESGLAPKIVFLTIHSEQPFGRGMHGRGSIGLCAQVPHEAPPDSSDTSGPCRTTVQLFICFYILVEGS